MAELDSLLYEFYGRDYERQTFLSLDKTQQAKAAIQSLWDKRERVGELYQLKMLKRWAELHNITVDIEDIDHHIKSLEQFPAQPLARKTFKQGEASLLQSARKRYDKLTDKEN